MSWTDGPPTKPGHYWIEQSGWVVQAFVYDGYPDDEQPPEVMTGKQFNEWCQRTPKHPGAFLRIRTMQGLLGLSDKEIGQLTVDRHMVIDAPAVLSARHDLENAVRTECAKFRFPDEDRPVLHDALVALDEATAKAAAK
jgi:hypothetical protein